MNTLDVTSFGVQELDAKEMVEVDGGELITLILGAATLLLAGGFIYETINHYDQMADAANEGYQAGKESFKRK